MNSSVISSLIAAGAVPSPEFGLFYGSRSMNYPSDGELVIGGYNSNRIKGPFANFSMAIAPLDQPCPLQVSLKDVRVTKSDGSSNSIMADSEGTVPACINPVENGFQLTPAMYESWATLTQHPWNPPSDGSHNYTEQTYPLSSDPLMNELIIELQGGYTVTIPHFELVSFERGSDAHGMYAVINSSRIQSAVTDNGGRFKFPILGSVFLSQNYLLVDYNRNIFSLAPAILSSPSNNTLTSTCSGGRQEIPVESSSSTGNTGAIVGIAIGSAAGLILLVAIAGGLLFLLKRRKHPATGTRPDRDAEKHVAPRNMSTATSASMATRAYTFPDASRGDPGPGDGYQRPQVTVAELFSPRG